MPTGRFVGFVGNSHWIIQPKGEAMTDADLRRLWRQWCDYGGDFPPECRDMTCGATTRAGTPCKRRDLYRSGRCKLHGGLSTGPRTKKGKRRSARNGKQAEKGKPHWRMQKPDDLGKSGGAAARRGG